MTRIDKREKPENLSPVQHVAILSSIASMAYQLTDLAQRTCDNAPNVEAVDVLTSAIESMARQIGFMADTACYRLDGSASPFGGDPYFWMMPRRYQEETRLILGAQE
jgi:hypothetical protein